MLTLNKWLLTGLVVTTAEIITIVPSLAQDASDPPLSHDTGMVSTNQSQVDNDVPTDPVNGILNTETGAFTVQGLDNNATSGNQVILAPDVVDAIESMGILNGLDPLSADSSNSFNICLSEPCVPSGEATQAITLNELAKLMEEDLQQSLNDLAAAEDLEQRASNQPRRFVRRRSLDCVNPAIQAREEVEKKVTELQKFVGQMEQLNPDNNVW